uniref:AP-5 complex subunit sigma-1 n=1 Tax=Parasteatoda tepidariorum TaxID=114398 RepID=A0A2L2YI91_PARTP
MVHSFIIAETNYQVLFSSVFNFLEDPDDREKQIKYFAQRVKKEFEFNTSVSSNNFDDFSEAYIVDIETKGIFNLKLKNVEKQIVWHSYYGCLYILVCDQTDNRILAASTLFFLIKTIKDLLPKITLSHSEIVQKADVISVVVNTFMPCGQLLFINNQAAQQLIKDIQKAIR